MEYNKGGIIPCSPPVLLVSRLNLEEVAVIEAALRWMAEIGGPAFDLTEEWCRPALDLLALIDPDEARMILKDKEE